MQPYRKECSHTHSLNSSNTDVCVTSDPSVQNCLVRWEGCVCSAVVGDFGLAEKIPDYRSVHNSPFIKTSINTL